MAIPSYLPQQANIRACHLLEGLTDESGNNYTLTNNNGVQFVAGLINNCADFGTANTDKSLSITNDLGIPGTAMTESALIKIRSQITTGVWMMQNQGDYSTQVYQRYYYDYNAGNYRINFNRAPMGVSNQIASYYIQLKLTEWYHIVYVYDGSNIWGFVNNNKTSLVASTQNGAGTVHPDGYSIGADNQDNVDYASAYIDEAVVWNIALTDTEVANLYAEYEKKMKPTAGFFHWFFSEAWQKHDKLWIPKLKEGYSY